MDHRPNGTAGQARATMRVARGRLSLREHIRLYVQNTNIHGLKLKMSCYNRV